MRVSSAKAAGIALSSDGLSEPRLLARGLGDLLRRADAGHHILALRIDQEFAIERLLAGRRIAGEGDAGRGIVAHIAEHHGLHVDRRAPAFRDVVQAAIGLGARIHPRAEHRADRAPELLASDPAETACRSPPRPLLVEADRASASRRPSARYRACSRWRPCARPECPRTDDARCRAPRSNTW